MEKPKLALQVPDHIICIPTDSASDSLLHGTLLVSNIPPQCSISITLARFGRLKRGEGIKSDTASRRILNGLKFMGQQKEQSRQEQFDFKTAEHICACRVSTPHGSFGSKTAKCEFDLLIPSYLPATATLPAVDISYAIFATCTLSNGKVSQTRQDLRIIREISVPIYLEPSRTVSFAETTFAVRTSFGRPSFDQKNTTIPTTLQLNGLNLPFIETMRMTETRWLVPREMRWDLEEIAVIVTGHPDATGHLPISTAQRILKRRKLATGKEQLKLNYPFTRPGNTHIVMHPDDTGLSIPFTVLAPKDISLGDSTALTTAGGHVLHTVLDRSASYPDDLQKRFAVYLEYKLHVWLRIGEDVFDEASGDLVNRKMDEMAYTVVCPLNTSRGMIGRQDEGAQDEPIPIIPPSYDGTWEQPPPDYVIPAPDYTTHN